MYTEMYDAITFDHCCNIFKLYFKWTYSKLAEALHCNERTLQRWRKHNTYNSLRGSNYALLFQLFETACVENKVNPTKLLIEYFNLPSAYLNEDYEKIKRLIIQNLNTKLDNQSSLTLNTKTYTSHFSPSSFILHRLNSNKKIKSICMAFHSGWDWLKKNEKRRIMDQINDLGIQLCVLVNHKDAIQDIAESMLNKELKKYYIGYNQGIRQWAVCETTMDHLELRISNYPIMRRCYVIRYEDGSYEVFKKNYTYDHSFSMHGEYHHYTQYDQDGEIYNNEFSFLWNHAQTYETWRAHAPLEEEQLLPDNYILLYKRNKPGNKELNQQFVISKLSIHENNKAKLEVNISDELTTPFVIKKMEYFYTGKAKVAKNNIYLNLHDPNNSEQITLSFARPLHECNRYIGIMNALSPASHPVSFKCVCIQEDLVSNLNLEVILNLLQHHNEVWGDHLMIIEENDSSEFYSNAIFK